MLKTVTYNQTTRLRALGYPVVFGEYFYIEEKGTGKGKLHKRGDPDPSFDIEKEYNLYPAPYLCEVEVWLAKEKNIYLDIVFSEATHTYTVVGIVYPDRKTKICSEGFSSREDAINRALCSVLWD